MDKFTKALIEDPYYIDLKGEKFTIIVTSNLEDPDMEKVGLDYVFLAYPEYNIVRAYARSGKEADLEEKLQGLDAQRSDTFWSFSLDMASSIREALAEFLAVEV